MSVSVDFQGRLGNNLFQLAAAASLAKDYDTEIILPEWEHFDDFRLKFKRSSKTGKHIFYWKEPGFNYTKIPYHGSVHLNGYFQSYKYFSHNDSYIRELFQRRVKPDNRIREYLLQRSTGNDTCTAIHVRRGDYIQLSHCHPVLKLSYYEEAMRLLDSTQYFVFSDDLEWCRENIKGKNVEYIDGNSPIVDFHSMTLCDNFIISNSSFSWWTAYLGGAPNKRVVSPDPYSNWFGPALSHYDMSDLIPEDWRVL